MIHLLLNRELIFIIQLFTCSLHLAISIFLSFPIFSALEVERKVLTFLRVKFTQLINKCSSVKMNSIKPSISSDNCNLSVKNDLDIGPCKNSRKNVYKYIHSGKFACRDKISRLRGFTPGMPKIYFNRTSKARKEKSKSLEKECVYPPPVKKVHNSKPKISYILLDVQRYMPQNISWFSGQILRLLYDIDHEIVTFDTRFAFIALQFQSRADQKVACARLRGVTLPGESVPLEPKLQFSNAFLEQFESLGNQNS